MRSHSRHYTSTTDYKVNWRINSLLLPHNLYSGTKHIPLFSQRPFHFLYSLVPFSIRSDKYNKVTKRILKKYLNLLKIFRASKVYNIDSNRSFKNINIHLYFFLLFGYKFYKTKPLIDYFISAVYMCV